MWYIILNSKYANCKVFRHGSNFANSKTPRLHHLKQVGKDRLKAAVALSNLQPVWKVRGCVSFIWQELIEYGILH